MEQVTQIIQSKPAKYRKRKFLLGSTANFYCNHQPPMNEFAFGRSHLQLRSFTVTEVWFCKQNVNFHYINQNSYIPTQVLNFPGQHLLMSISGDVQPTPLLPTITPHPPVTFATPCSHYGREKAVISDDCLKPDRSTSNIHHQ